MSTTTQHPDHGDLAEGGVLAVYAHPDDETLTAGGLLALAAGQGRRVAVVTATRGERGEMIGTPDLEGTAAVAPAREAERTQALEMLGVTERYWLDELPGALPATDSGMTWLRPGVACPHRMPRPMPSPAWTSRPRPPRSRDWCARCAPRWWCATNPGEATATPTTCRPTGSRCARWSWRVRTVRG